MCSGIEPPSPRWWNTPGEVVVGEITAYRVWRYEPATGLLLSPMIGVVWVPGCPMEAGRGFADLLGTEELWGQRRTQFINGIYPGVFAFKELRRASEQVLYVTRAVVGEVKLWGHAFEATRGYEAEYACISKVTYLAGAGWPWWGFRRRRILAQLRATYGIE